MTEQRSSRQLNQKFKVLDANADGVIDFTEFCDACGEGADAAAVRELYDLLDENGNGFIERKEFRRQLRENEEIITRARQFGSGLNDLAEGRQSVQGTVEHALMAGRLSRKKSRRRSSRKAREMEMVAAFGKLDANGDGELSYEEFTKVCGGSDADQPTVRKLFDLLDEDGGGTIDVRELSNALKHSEEATSLAAKFEQLHELVDLSRKRKKSHRHKHKHHHHHKGKKPGKSAAQKRWGLISGSLKTPEERLASCVLLAAQAAGKKARKAGEAGLNKKFNDFEAAVSTRKGHKISWMRKIARDKHRRIRAQPTRRRRSHLRRRRRSSKRPKTLRYAGRRRRW